MCLFRGSHQSDLSSLGRSQFTPDTALMCLHLSEVQDGDVLPILAFEVTLFTVASDSENVHGSFTIARGTSIRNVVHRSSHWAGFHSLEPRGKSTGLSRSSVRSTEYKNDGFHDSFATINRRFSRSRLRHLRRNGDQGKHQGQASCILAWSRCLYGRVPIWIRQWHVCFPSCLTRLLVVLMKDADSM